jgi:hypothetical protein
VGVKGDYYVVSVNGTTTIDGISNWGVGDWITYNGGAWQRVEGGADLNGVNVDFTGTATGPTFETSNATAGLTISGNGIVADGTDTNINIEISPKGTGKILAATGGGWVGTVSQNGQSSIIERGSNANGEFVKFADGTMICQRQFTSVVSFGDTLTLPSTFVNSTYSLAFNNTQSASQQISTSAKTSSTFTMRILTQTFTAGSASLLEFIAIGRWF